jgi:hypothetical protein
MGDGVPGDTKHDDRAALPDSICAKEHGEAQASTSAVLSDSSDKEVLTKGRRGPADAEVTIFPSSTVSYRLLIPGSSYSVILLPSYWPIVARAAGMANAG